MAWKRVGHIFEPTKRYSWMESHAQLPIVTRIDNTDLYRIYFSSRDKLQRSQGGYIDVDINDPTKIISISNQPILKYGPYGFFDEHGAHPSSIIEINGKKFMYYIGWNKGFESPMFYTSIGLAISEDGGKSFKKYSNAPIMSRSEYDPWMVSAPFVFSDGHLYRMYYLSGLKWERDENNKLRSFYHVKYAESTDGINWKRNGKIIINYLDSKERDICRVCVIKEADRYKAFFAYNSIDHQYKLAYAESSDGINFDRKTIKLEMLKNKNNFDDEMMAYPYVISHKGQKFLFYNGNNYGKMGIGLLRWENN